MANINSITSNSYSSSTNLYGNRNVLTGLASGMDTEAMIQNSVTGYQAKISELQQNVTKLEWKQDAYRGLTDQMYNINQKYMSFTSQTNLSSNAFFNNAVSTVTQGTNAAAISATGSSKSDIQINAVKQLATAARYSIDADVLGFEATGSTTGTAIDWSRKETVGQVKGTMTLKYGSQSIDIKFTDEDTFGFEEGDTKEQKANKLKSFIESKLGEVDIKTSTGTVKARALIDVKVENGKFTFSENSTHPDKSGTSVYINSVSGNVTEMLGATRPSSTENTAKFANNSFTVGNFDNLVKTPSMAEYLTGKTIDVTLDGVTKQIKIGDLTEPDLTSLDDKIQTKKSAMDALESGSDEWWFARTEYLEAMQEKTDTYKNGLNEQLKTSLQSQINKQFGNGKITVNIKDGALDFDLKEKTSMLKVSSEAGEKLGIGTGGVSNYFNTGKTLKDMLGSDWLNRNSRIAATGTVTAKTVDDEVRYFDADGNRVASLYDDHKGEYYRVDDEGNFLYSMKINGATIDGLTEKSTLESVLSKINGSADAGVKVSFSNLTNQFVFSASETGEGGQISFDDPLAKKLFTADNSPEGITLEKFFGDAVNWDENGKATFMFTGYHGRYENLGELDKTMTVQTMIDKIESLDSSLKDVIRYDSEIGTYSLYDRDGNPMEERKANGFGFWQMGQQQDFGLTPLLSAIKGAEREAGKDAVVDATVNGKQITLQRASNVVNMDGMNVTLKEEFSAYGEDGKLTKADAVTFKTSSNADDIISTVRSFVEDINKLMTDVYNAYSTQPLKKSSSSTSREGYEPLTEDDKNGMSESAIAAYEEKAKTGLLFGDTDLANLYDKLRDTIQSFGSDRVTLESIGLSTTYSNRVTTIAFDEAKMRSALESDPDKVRNAFTKSKEGGAATNGLITSLKSTINTYASTSIATPGVLVRKAGTKLSSLSLLNNNIQKQIDTVNNQIESWQTKLSNKIDYYTKQFTALEKLMSTMNNQSSMLADLMGY